MRRLAIISRKGGTGKTTTAVHLGAAIAETGANVLLVDCDVQGHCLKLLGASAPAGLGELIEGKVKPDEAVFEARPNLWVLAGGSSLAGVERWIITRPAAQERELSKVLSSYNGRFDYIVLDCPPGFSALSINAIVYCSEILVPVSQEVLSVSGLLDLEEELEELKDYGMTAELSYILPTFYDRRNAKTREITEQLKERYGERVLDPIRFSVRFSEAPSWGKTVFEYDAKGRGAEDYRALCRRLLEWAK